MSAIIRDGDEEMKKLICVLLVLFTMSACSEKAVSKHTTTMTDVGFDTFVNFTGYTTNEAQFEEYASDLKKEFKRYDKLFDKYNDYEGTHNIKTINDQAGIKPVNHDGRSVKYLARLSR